MYSLIFEPFHFVTQTIRAVATFKIVFYLCFCIILLINYFHMIEFHYISLPSCLVYDIITVRFILFNRASNNYSIMLKMTNKTNMAIS